MVHGSARTGHNAGMALLPYTAITSLDGYVNDAEGGFSWAEPSEELHRVVNDQEREVGTYLLGRRMYETMRFWETAPGDVPGPMGEYARIWRSLDKVVFSTSLDDVTTARTRLETSFDPAAVEALKASTVLDIGVGGPTLAAAAFRAGLVDEVHLFLHPVMVGGGTRALPDEVHAALDLVAVDRIGEVVHLHHRRRRG